MIIATMKIRAANIVAQYEASSAGSFIGGVFLFWLVVVIPEIPACEGCGDASECCAVWVIDAVDDC